MRGRALRHSAETIAASTIRARASGWSISRALERAVVPDIQFPARNRFIRLLRVFRYALAASGKGRKARNLAPRARIILLGSLDQREKERERSAAAIACWSREARGLGARPRRVNGEGSFD